VTTDGAAGSRTRAAMLVAGDDDDRPARGGKREARRLIAAISAGESRVA
jgi:hypothetical protein